MAFTGEYKCSKCGKNCKRELLSAKKVVFQEIGVKPRVIRTRVVAWLCPDCMKVDEDFNRAAYDSPGMRDAAPAR